MSAGPLPDFWPPPHFLYEDKDPAMPPTPALEPSPEHLLSPRERQILNLLAQGYSNAEVSLELDLSVKTVRNQISEIYATIGVHSRVLATRWALRTGVACLAPSPLERRY